MQVAKKSTMAEKKLRISTVYGHLQRLEPWANHPVQEEEWGIGESVRSLHR